MMKKYDLQSPADLIELAKEIQVNVYWGSSFYYGDDLQIPYKNLWHMISEKVDTEGATTLLINDNDVSFDV